MNKNFKFKYQFNRLLLLFGILFLQSFSVLAQKPIKITGVVFDPKGETLPFVNVIIKGQIGGTTTDDDGYYAIDVPNSKTILQFSFVGYKTEEIIVGDQTKIDVVLNSEFSELDEVVVVGYTTQRRESLTGALTAIDSKKLMDITAPTTSSLLAGKVTGIFSSQSSGRPGTSSDIVIRGKTTVNGSTDPLWVIDGVIIGTNSDGLNPNDIETITVLKDAASTAIYGSIGSNGVIVVTTKKAKAGTSSVNFSAKLGFNKLTLGNLKLMDSRELYNYFNSFSNKSQLGPKFNDDLLKRNFDWFDFGTHLGTTQEYNLSLSGGTEKLKTYISLGYYDEKGAVKGYDYKRLSGRFNVDYKFTDFITIKPSFSIIRSDIDDREHDVNSLYRNMPWDSPYSWKDGHILSNKEAGIEWFKGSNSVNYFYDRQWNYTNSKMYDLMTGLDFEVKLTNYLIFSSTNNYKFSYEKRMTYTDPRSSNGEADEGSVFNYRADNYRYFSNQMLRFTKSFDKHFVSALLAYEYNEYFTEWNSNTKTKIMPGLAVPDAGAVSKAINGHPKSWAVQSYFFNGNYSFDNKYLAQLSFRRDGASNFGKNKEYGNFFSISGGWNLHNESFYNLKNIINVFKLRASYGSTGNRPNEFYPQYGLYSVDVFYNENPGAIISQLPNNNLTWEKTYTVGIGADLRFFDKIGLTIDLYNKNTSNLLYKVPLPAVVGVTSIWDNVGEVNNKGFEISVSADIFKTNDFMWSVEANIGVNKNKITKLYGGNQIIIDDGSKTQGSAKKLLKEGLDMDSWYIQEWAGVDSKTGDPMWYKTQNGERVKTFSRREADQVVLSSAAPSFTGGFNTNLYYKGITLSAVFNYVVGGKIYNYMRTEIDSDGAYTDRNQMSLKKGWSRWQKEGDIATHPRPLANGNNNSEKASSRFLENGSYLRLRNITLGYTIPKHLLSFVNAHVYVSGENLLTFTGFSGIDPELGLNRVSKFNYPITKKIMFGVNLNF